MKSSHLRLLAVCLVLAGLGLAGLASRKTVILEIDGESRTLTSFAWTVGQLLRQQKLTLAPGDSLQPPPGAWLKNGDKVKLDHAAQVLLRAGSRAQTVLSTGRTPAGFIAQASLPIHPGDRIFYAGALISPDEPLPRASAYSLTLRPSIAILLREATSAGEQVHTINSAAATLGQALWETGIRLYAADRLSLPPETPLDPAGAGQPLEVSLIRSQELVIRVGASRIRTRVAAATIGEALARAGIPLQGLDTTRPTEDSPLPADGRIRLVQVRENVIIEESPLPFETEYQASANVELDQQAILDPGELGLVARRVRVRYEDGVEVSRQVEDEWTARQPKNRVFGYGTKIVMRRLNSPDGVIRYWRAVRMWATSYNPTSAGGDTTASGKKLRKGLVAIDHSLIPFGTMMYVPGYGMAEAADTGAIRGRWIDLGYSDGDYKSWHEWVTVYFLWPPPANPVWVFP